MNTRAVNMQRRRERILGEARRVIAEQGYEALSTRSLAQAAGVSAPTLYNLIGNKAKILEALELEAATVIEARLQLGVDRTPLQLAQAIVAESCAVFAEDENYYRAAFVAGDQLAAQDPNATTRLDTRAVQLARDVCAELIRIGALRETVAADDLAEQMYSCYGAWLRRWGYGHIDLQEFGKQTMRGFCLILAADAVDNFRMQLLNHIGELDSPAKTTAAK